MMQKQLTKESSKSTEEKVVETVPVDTENAQALVKSTDELMDDIDRILAEVGEAFQEKTEELDPEKSYTLADAMREGSAVTNQKIGGWTDPQNGETCALSAAYLACRARGLVKK